MSATIGNSSDFFSWLHRLRENAEKLTASAVKPGKKAERKADKKDEESDDEEDDIALTDDKMQLVQFHQRWSDLNKFIYMPVNPVSSTSLKGLIGYDNEDVYKGKEKLAIKPVGGAEAAGLGSSEEREKFKIRVPKSVARVKHFGVHEYKSKGNPFVYVHPFSALQQNLGRLSSDLDLEFTSMDSLRLYKV